MNRPFVSIDIESTGLDVANDRIIELAIVRPNIQLVYLFNPLIPIPKEASDVHGFTNEDLENSPTFGGSSAAIMEQIEGKDLVGFNLLNFDIPMLWEEFFRSGIVWDLSDVRVFDVGNIFKKKEQRTLEAAVKFYLDRDHQGAHGAVSDAMATYDVLQKQLEVYADLGGMSEDDLAKWCKMDDRVDLAGKLVRNADGVICYGFGNSKGMPVLSDLGFARWMMSKNFSSQTKLILERVVNGSLV